MRSLTVFLIVWLLPVSRVCAESELPLRIFRYIYNQQYDSAHILLNKNKAQLDRFYFTLLEVDLAYWENITGTDNPDYIAFENLLTKYDLDESTTREEKTISLIRLSYQLRYDYKRYHFFSALHTRNKTIALHNEIKTDLQLSNQDQTSIFRLYNALILYFNQYPSRYFSGTARSELENAISEMTALNASDSEIIRTLSAYFLGKIYLQYEKTPEKAVQLFTYLTKNYPNNQKFKEYLNECRQKSE